MRTRRNIGALTFAFPLRPFIRPRPPFASAIQFPTSMSYTSTRSVHMAETEQSYRAFISYSQKDKRFAAWLHRALEAYRAPFRDHPSRRRLGRCFRDDEEMAATADLGAALRAAIDRADNLIVICSPDAARSRWVNEEILHFRATGRSSNIFAVILAGEPNAAADEIECFPPALKYPSEPLALDARKDSKPRLVTRLAAGLLDLPI